MNSLTVKNRLPQLRMIPVPGLPLFRYERRVANRWVACNHSRATAIVGVYYRRAKALCANSTAGLKTVGGSPFVSSAGNQKRSALSTCVLANLDGLLRGDSASRATFMQTMVNTGIRTVNEVRRLDNLPPLPGGDVATRQSQNVPITDLGTSKEPRNDGA